MNTRRATLRAHAHRLTNREIQNAIDANVVEAEDGNESENVNSDEEAVDEITDSEEDENFEPNSSESESDDESEETESTSRVDTREAAVVATSNVYTGRDNTEWNAEPVDQIPNRFRNLQIDSKVNLPPGKRLDSAMDCFRLIFDDSLLAIIVRFTNIEAKKHNASWKEIDQNELLAYIGLLIIAGVDRSSKRNYSEFFNRLRGFPIFRATMSRDRFKSFLRFIRFDDKDSRSVRRARDKLAPIRDVFDIVNKNLTKHFQPGKNITIDEQLVPFRGRCAFKQYIPSKPDKYGLKLFWVCDAKTAYPLKAVPYLGEFIFIRFFLIVYSFVDRFPRERTYWCQPCDECCLCCCDGAL